MLNGNRKESVLILGAHARASLPVLESCAAMGLYVIAGSHKRHCCGMYSRAVNERLLYPCEENEPEACIDFILGFLTKRKISVLFPVGDVMTNVVAQHQSVLREHVNLVVPEYEVFVQGRNKILTLKAAQRAGCPIPITWYPSEQSLISIAKEAEYPVLIKPAVSAGARGIIFCYSKQDLLEKFGQIESQYGESFVQDFVPQGGKQYKVDAIVDDKQNLLSGIVYAKLRYYPANGGSSVMNKTEYRPDILGFAMKVLNEIKWFGFCDFDFITDPRDNTVKLMEINPRFPESYRTTAAGGLDMTKIIYQLAKSQKPVPQLIYKENCYNRFLLGDIMWFLTTKENRWKVEPPFFSFPRKDTVDQLIRLRDWGPFIGYLLENLSLFWNKEQRKFLLRLRDARGQNQQ